MIEGLPPPMALFRMASGFYVSRAIHVAAKLGIADLLTALSLSLFGCRRLVAGSAPRRKPASRSEPPSSRGWT
jgi:hypothetical protein